MLVIASQITFLQKIYSGSVWETRIDLESERVRPLLVQQMLIGDVWWYRAIAEDGYRDSDQWPAAGKAAFFPLYPMLARLFRVTGEFALNGAILSNLCFLGGLIALMFLANGCAYRPDDVERTLFYLAFFPTSYFFSMPLTESLFLFVSILAFVGVSSERWWLAGAGGALAALTRINGILLFPVLLLLAWQRARRLRIQLLWLSLIPLATVSVGIYHYVASGNALAFLGAQRSWGRQPGAFWQPLIGYLSDPGVISETWNLLIFNFAVAILLFVCAAALIRRGSWAFGLYALLSVLFALSSGSLQSLGRYALVVFPLFLWLGILGRSAWIDRAITAITVSLFGCFLILFVLRVDFVLA